VTDLEKLREAIARARAEDHGYSFVIGSDFEFADRVLAAIYASGAKVVWREPE
jgi:hypothetical protein